MMCMSYLELCAQMIVTKCDMCQVRYTIGNKLVVLMAARRRGYSTLNAVTVPEQGTQRSAAAGSGTR